MISEFDVIKQYFTGRGITRKDVVVGVGDDGAVVRVPEGMELVLSTDTLVADVHFSADMAPGAIGHKALAVNLSDMAAMGAAPAWATLALTMPEIDAVWLEGFSQGVFKLAEEYGIQLLGGDTTHGSLAVTMQVIGFVPPGQALLRNSARVGDLIYVSGTLGDAGLALLASKGTLAISQQDQSELMHKLWYPQARVKAGVALRGIANAAIDISDGLAADLQHILLASGVGACIEVESLPVSAAFRRNSASAGDWGLALSAGDDYELCFTLPQQKTTELQRLSSHLGCLFTCIGRIEKRPGLRCVLSNGNEFNPTSLGYQHFDA